MRYALPIFWCVSAETKGLLASMVTGLCPKPEWVEWGTKQPVKEFEDYEELFREMAKPQA